MVGLVIYFIAVTFLLRFDSGYNPSEDGYTASLVMLVAFIIALIDAIRNITK